MAITRPCSVARDFARDILAFRPELPDAGEATWTPEEQADYELWERDFEKRSEDPEDDEFLAWAEAEFQWGRPVPLC